MNLTDSYRSTTTEIYGFLQSTDVSGPVSPQSVCRFVRLFSRLWVAFMGVFEPSIVFWQALLLGQKLTYEVHQQ